MITPNWRYLGQPQLIKLFYAIRDEFPELGKMGDLEFAVKLKGVFNEDQRNWKLQDKLLSVLGRRSPEYREIPRISAVKILKEIFEKATTYLNPAHPPKSHKAEKKKGVIH